MLHGVAQSTYTARVSKYSRFLAFQSTAHAHTPYDTVHVHVEHRTLNNYLTSARLVHLRNSIAAVPKPNHNSTETAPYEYGNSKVQDLRKLFGPYCMHLFYVITFSVIELNSLKLEIHNNDTCTLNVLLPCFACESSVG